MSIRRNRPVGNIVQSLSDSANKLTKGEKYYLSNFNIKRELNTRDASINDVANMLCTLIDDLKKRGLVS